LDEGPRRAIVGGPGIESVDREPLERPPIARSAIVGGLGTKRGSGQGLDRARGLHLHRCNPP